MTLDFLHENSSVLITQDWQLVIIYDTGVDDSVQVCNVQLLVKENIDHMLCNLVVWVVFDEVS